MLKFLLMILFLAPLSFMNNMFWMVQNMLFILPFSFILMNWSVNFFVNISYFFGCDLISYGLVLLSMWICSLMLMASESIYSYNKYVNFFLFNIIILLFFFVLHF